jgi:hypothetical protein
VDLLVHEPLDRQPLDGFRSQRLLDEDRAAVVELGAPVRVDAAVAAALNAFPVPDLRAEKALDVSLGKALAEASTRRRRLKAA